MVWLPFSHKTALRWRYAQGRGSVSGKSPVGFTRPVPNAHGATSNWGMGSALSWEKGRTRGEKRSTGAEKYPNTLCEAGWECKKFRGVGLTSERGWWATTMSSGPWTVPQPVWATGKRPGSKQRHQPSPFLGPGIYSFCLSRKFTGFGIHKVLLLGWELTHSTKHIHLIFSMLVMQYPEFSQNKHISLLLRVT